MIGSGSVASSVLTTLHQATLLAVHTTTIGVGKSSSHVPSFLTFNLAFVVLVKGEPLHPLGQLTEERNPKHRHQSVLSDSQHYQSQPHP